jgi:hypothetical protein
MTRLVIYHLDRYKICIQLDITAELSAGNCHIATRDITSMNAPGQPRGPVDPQRVNSHETSLGDNKHFLSASLHESTHTSQKGRRACASGAANIRGVTRLGCHGSLAQGRVAALGSRYKTYLLLGVSAPY